MFPLGETTVAPLNWKMKLLLGHFGVLVPLNQQAAKKEANLLAGVIDLDYQGEIGLLLYYGVKEAKSGIQGILGAFLLVFLFTVVKVNGKLCQPKKGRMINDSHLSRMKVWGLPCRSSG